MNQIAIDKIFFPLVIVLQDFVKSAVVIVFMLIWIWCSGFEGSINWLWLPIIIFVQLLLIAAVSLVCSAVVPFLPDLRFIIQTGTMVLMFGSGIFYSYKDVLLPEHQDLFLLNPLANLIRMYRELLMEGIAPLFSDLFIIGVGSFVVIIIMSLIYKRLGPYYPRLALQ